MLIASCSAPFGNREVLKVFKKKLNLPGSHDGSMVDCYIYLYIYHKIQPNGSYYAINIPYRSNKDTMDVSFSINLVKL